MLQMILLLFLTSTGHAASLNTGESSPLTKDSSPQTCMFLHCPLQVAACVLDPGCYDTLMCMGDCDGKPDMAQCQFNCEMTLGIDNEAFQHLMDCIVENGCMEKLPDDGSCLAGPEDTVQSVTEIEQVAGGWWVVSGVNCGQDLWPGALDWYPCQHERYLQLDDGGWINNTTYCGGSDSICTTDQLVTAPHATLPSPGLIRLEYDDVPLLPQIEKWHIVSWPEPDFMMVIWCGENPALNYNGGFVLSRGRTQEGMLPETEAAFRTTSTRLGFDYDTMCVSDNSACPEEP